jgi:hypothetical protein
LDQSVLPRDLKVSKPQAAPSIRRIGEEALRRWMWQYDKRHAKLLRDGSEALTGAAAQRDDLL